MSFEAAVLEGDYNQGALVQLLKRTRCWALSALYSARLGVISAGVCVEGSERPQTI
jgi:hypothetical protein